MLIYIYIYIYCYCYCYIYFYLVDFIHHIQELRLSFTYNHKALMSFEAAIMLRYPCFTIQLTHTGS